MPRSVTDFVLCFFFIFYFVFVAVVGLVGRLISVISAIFLISCLGLLLDVLGEFSALFFFFNADKKIPRWISPTYFYEMKNIRIENWFGGIRNSSISFSIISNRLLPTGYLPITSNSIIFSAENRKKRFVWYPDYLKL